MEVCHKLSATSTQHTSNTLPVIELPLQLCMLLNFHSDGNSYTHGTTGSDTTSYTLDITDQQIFAVSVRYKSYLDQITVLTIQPSSGERFMFGPYGGSGEGSGFQLGLINSFYGRSGTGIDQIGVRGSMFPHSK